ncbi:MAG: DUF6531 domain-containing protein [Anaerolineae bacterium]
MFSQSLPLLFPLLFLLLQTFLFAELRDPSVLAVTEGERELNVFDSVNAITGDFTIQQQDLVIQGAEPLPLRRFYVSGDGTGFLAGWTFFPHQELIFKKGKEAIVSEPSGTTVRYTYHHTKKGCYDAYLIKTEDRKGMANTSHGMISGRTNLKNNVL